LAIKIFKNGKPIFIPEAHEINKRLDDKIKQNCGSILVYDNIDALTKITGEINKLYKTQDTNKIYQWDGEQFIPLQEVVGPVTPTEPVKYDKICGGNAFGNGTEQ
jgi:hypothetical protein